MQPTIIFVINLTPKQVFNDIYVQDKQYQWQLHHGA